MRKDNAEAIITNFTAELAIMADQEAQFYEDQKRREEERIAAEAAEREEQERMAKEELEMALQYKKDLEDEIDFYKL